MTKKEARKYFREKRSAITPVEKQKWDDLLLIQFQSIEMPFLSTVFSFYPIEQNNEINTFLITDYLHFLNPNLTICYARTDTKALTMQAVACNADSIFEANEYNIPEPLDNDVVSPESIDAAILPLLAFDLNGNRVGYGKGFYDRNLQNCRKDCLLIGMSYFDPLDAIGDAGQFDVPLNICITPRQTYVF